MSVSIFILHFPTNRSSVSNFFPASVFSSNFLILNQDITLNYIHLIRLYLLRPGTIDRSVTDDIRVKEAILNEKIRKFLAVRLKEKSFRDFLFPSLYFLRSVSFFLSFFFGVGYKSMEPFSFFLFVFECVLLFSIVYAYRYFLLNVFQNF